MVSGTRRGFFVALDLHRLHGEHGELIYWLRYLRFQNQKQGA
jgi:hypothetical protein